MELNICLFRRCQQCGEGKLPAVALVLDALFQIRKRVGQELDHGGAEWLNEYITGFSQAFIAQSYVPPSSLLFDICVIH